MEIMTTIDSYDEVGGFQFLGEELELEVRVCGVLDESEEEIIIYAFCAVGSIILIIRIK